MTEWGGFGKLLIGLGVAVGLNVVGLNVGKWMTNISALAGWIPIGLLLVFGFYSWMTYGSATPITAASLMPSTGFKDVIFWSTIAFAFGGVENASTMGDEIVDARRTIPRAILTAAAFITIIYIVATLCVLLAPRVLPARRAREMSADLSGHARTLVTAQDPAGLAKQIVEEGLSVRQAEALAQMPAGGTPPKAKPAQSGSDKDADTLALEKLMTDTIGMIVAIEHKGKGGVLRVNYRTLEQLDELEAARSMYERAIAADPRRAAAQRTRGGAPGGHLLLDRLRQLDGAGLGGAIRLATGRHRKHVHGDAAHVRSHRDGDLSRHRHVRAVDVQLHGQIVQDVAQIYVHETRNGRGAARLSQGRTRYARTDHQGRRRGEHRARRVHRRHVRHQGPRAAVPPPAARAARPARRHRRPRDLGEAVDRERPSARGRGMRPSSARWFARPRPYRRSP